MNALSRNGSAATQPSKPKTAPRHTLFDDLQALVSGALLVALGVTLLGQARLMTGGTVGLAFLLHYYSGLPFGALFFCLNLPFYYLAVKKLGWTFTLKTMAAISLMALFSEWMPQMIRLDRIEPVYAATMGGLLAGVGLLALFRHRASLGGFNVFVLYLQERFGIRAGLTQLILDAIILMASIPVITLRSVAISLVGAAVLNLTLAVNHRPGRYATS
ncbi:YitT family protein [Noviherbaspirillum sp. 17J57-3]|uniref:YitT family protein n=2 Tax=Noviherbaspirillum galbum TaxID=2709383 RepID=A0A6B3SNI6_9BURK|nr:YitT family protein [Noviherbaspirillum galbum]